MHVYQLFPLGVAVDFYHAKRQPPMTLPLTSGLLVQEAQPKGVSAGTSAQVYKQHVAGTIGELRGDMKARP